MATARLFGSDGDPTPRGVVSFVFPRCSRATSQCRSHLQSGLASGLGKLSPCRVIGVRGKTYRREIHGSTSGHRNGLCAVAPVSHAYLGASECEH